MALTIVAAGDSFIWGSELLDSPHGGSEGYSKNTFPALLAKTYKFNYECIAYPGASNRDICNQILKYKLNKHCFIITSWSWPSRDNKLESNQEILVAQQYLDKNKIGYLFTCADNCIVNTNDKIYWDKWYLFPIIVNSGWHSNENPRGFYQWALEHKYELAVRDKHPLEQAHRDAAILMKDKFDELVKKHLVQNSIRNSIS